MNQFLKILWRVMTVWNIRLKRIFLRQSLMHAHAKKPLYFLQIRKIEFTTKIMQRAPHEQTKLELDLLTRIQQNKPPAIQSTWYRWILLCWRLRYEVNDFRIWKNWSGKRYESSPDLIRHSFQMCIKSTLNDITGALIITENNLKRDKNSVWTTSGLKT